MAALGSGESLCENIAWIGVLCVSWAEIWWVPKGICNGTSSLGQQSMAFFGVCGMGMGMGLRFLKEDNRWISKYDNSNLRGLINLCLLVNLWCCVYIQHTG